MRSRYLPPLVAIVICAIMIGFNAARASSFADDTAPPQEPANPEVAITPLLQYQGRMTNPTTGQPVADGVYAITFKLYDVTSGGTAKWTETKNVAVAGGLFSTLLGDTSPLPQSLFNGQALWLGVKVGSDLEATPRQAIVPVAYALSLVPGAVISANLSIPGLHVSNTTTYGVRGETTTTDFGKAGVVGAAGWSSTTFNRVAGILGQTVNGYGVAGASTNYYGSVGLSNNSDGVRGEALGSGSGVSGYGFGTGVGVNGTSSESHGVRGTGGSGSGDYGGYFSGYGGVYGYSPNWVGIYGESGGGWGVYGTSPTGYGVMGSSDDGYGVYGRTYTTTRYAGYFLNSSGTGTTRGPAVGGFTGNGSSADITAHGYWRAGGEFAGPNGVIGAASDTNGIGVVGINAYSGPAIQARKPSGVGGDTLQALNYGTGNGLYVYNGSSSTGEGVTIYNHGSGEALSVRNYGTGLGGYFFNSSAHSGDAFSFYGEGAGYTLNAYSQSNGYGLWASKSGGGNYAAYFSGNVHVNGNLSKSSGSFKIDHPLDPANKYLVHSFIESPDMMNVYNGNITTDGNGEATVILPDYFEALNRDFRYQLTVIGQFAQAIVKDEIKNNQFTIMTDKPNVKVSWQVTGIRQDPWANDNRIQVEEAKSAGEQGLYLYPQGYGLLDSTGVDYAHNQALQSRSSAPAIPPTQTVPLMSTIAPTTPPEPYTPAPVWPPVVPSPSTVP